MGAEEREIAMAGDTHDGGPTPEAVEPRIEPEYVERDADLFEAGEYPDKCMTVKPEDLDILAQSPDVPVMIEHSGGPIRIGIATAFERVGNWLKGKLKLVREASELMDKVGIHGVSVAVTQDLSRLLEVSWTGSPRVQGARVYSGGAEKAIVFSLGAESSHKEDNMAEITPNAAAAPPAAPAQMSPVEVSAAVAEMQARYSQLEQSNAKLANDAATSRAQLEQFRAELRARDITQTVDNAIMAGQLPPVAREFATAILQSDGVVRFNDADTPVAELFKGLMATLPRRFGKPLAGAGTSDPAANMTEAERAFFARHFPDLALENVAEFGLKAEV